MTLTNVAFFPSYTWANPSITSLEKQVLFNDLTGEMGVLTWNLLSAGLRFQQTHAS